MSQISQFTLQIAPKYHQWDKLVNLCPICSQIHNCNWTSHSKIRKTYLEEKKWKLNPHTLIIKRLKLV